MKIAGLVDALNLLTDLPFTEWAWSEAPADGYGVVTADGQSELKADADPAAEKMLTGYVDVFIKATDPDPTEDVEDAMRAIGVWFSMQSIQFEPETGFLHFEWRYADSMNNAKKVILDTLPLILHITGTEEVVSGSHTYRKVTFATGEPDLIYENAFKRDMYVELPVWDGVAGQTQVMCMRKVTAKLDPTNKLLVMFTCEFPKSYSNDQEIQISGYGGYILSVFFASGVYNSAVASKYEWTME